MPRTRSEAEYVNNSFTTPKANERVPIRPLKRERDGEEDEEAYSRSPSPERRENKLSPRKLNMEQAVVLANPAVESDDDEEEPRLTQPYIQEEEAEEGELPALDHTQEVDA